MSWRTVVISSNAKLDYQMGYLVIRGKDTHKIFLNEISLLIVESTAVSMTAYLLSELVKKKIKVVFCDEKRNPSSELMAYYGSHDTSQKIRKQMEWSEETKKLIWTEIVREKIKNQADLLKLHEKDECQLLYSYLDEIEYGDKTNREGHAAKVYFNALFGKEFSRSDDNPINAMLNYGYTILLSMFNREIVSNGYLTQIGVFHDNMFNQFNLGSDFMEPFRPIVDEFTVSYMPDIFEKEQKHELLSILENELVIDRRIEYLPNAVKVYVRSLFDAISDRDISKIKFYRL